MARSRKDGCEDQPNTRLKFDAGRIAATDAQGRRRGVLSFQDGHPGEAPACTAPFGGVGRPRGRAAPGMPVPGLDRSTPVADVFACFEAYGLRPFPNVAGWDRQTSIDRLEACIAVPRNLLEDVAPDPRIGINNPALHFEADDPKDSSDDTARTTDKYNYPPNVMFDLARIGVGTLRHLQGPDLAWLHLVGDDVPIARPGKLRSSLPDSQWSAFGRFTYAVITCLYSGQRVIPLIFGAGGGSSNPPVGVNAARPAFQQKVYVPVDAGWDPWYWDLGNHTPGPAARCYQQYSLNLVTASGPPDAYHLECCYRKCLGLLAFADLVGTYMARLAAAIADCTDGAMVLTDVVPAIECGNEMDSFYDLSTATNLQDAAREFGRYHALLAGPILARGLGLRARLGETFFAIHVPSGWDQIVLWLRETITVGVVEEVDRWHLMAAHPVADPLWSRLAMEAQWTWWTTPGASCAGDLVHEVGFHMFTWQDSAQSIYRPETSFADEAAQMVSEVVRHRDVLAALGHGLEWSCCVGFQGSRPSIPDSNDQYFVDNTLLHQGGMVARRMLAAYAQPTPPTFVTWYASMGGLTRGRTGWDLYSSSGVRNVLFGEIDTLAEPLGPFPFDQGGFQHKTHAWPRPAWYTFRRIAWLMARAARVERVFQDPGTGLMVVRLVAAKGFSPPACHAAPAGKAWRYAYVAWLDGTQSPITTMFTWVIGLGASPIATSGPSPSTAPRARLPGGELLPLVPTLFCGTKDSSPPPDRYDFASAVSVDWDATPQASIVVSRATPAGSFLEIEVHRSQPTSNPAPICLLCDLEVVSIRTRQTTGVPNEAGVASLGFDGVVGPSIEDAVTPPEPQCAAVK